MATIGTDCDITLTHPSLHSGDPYGFILTPDPTHGRSGVSIQREVDIDGNINIFLFFSIMLADDLLDPDGGEHTDDRETMYEMLLDFLEQTTQIALSTVLGTWCGIGSLGHTATELHLIKGSVISVKFTNMSEYRPPVDSELFLASAWQPAVPELDALTWETSLWR